MNALVLNKVLDIVLVVGLIMCIFGIAGSIVDGYSYIYYLSTQLGALISMWALIFKD